MRAESPLRLLTTLGLKMEFNQTLKEFETYAHSTIEWICGDYDDAKIQYFNNQSTKVRKLIKIIFIIKKILVFKPFVSDTAEGLFEFKVEIPCSRMSPFYQKSQGVVSDDEDLLGLENR